MEDTGRYLFKMFMAMCLARFSISPSGRISRRFMPPAGRRAYGRESTGEFWRFSARASAICRTLARMSLMGLLCYWFRLSRRNFDMAIAAQRRPRRITPFRSADAQMYLMARAFLAGLGSRHARRLLAVPMPPTR